MEKTKFRVISKMSEKYSPDLIVHCVAQTAKDKPDYAEYTSRSFQRACKMGDFKGNDHDIIVLYDDDGKSTNKIKRIAFVGTGVNPKKMAKDELREKLRVVGGNISKLCQKIKASRICIVPPISLKSQSADTAYCITEGIMLGDYNFRKYKAEKENKDKYIGIKEVKYITTAHLKNIRKNISLAINSSISACHARDMANEPGNKWTPESFAHYANELSHKYNLRCKILEKGAMKKAGMGGILAVNQGSACQPKLIILEYISSRKSDTILLVGKGLTFDSGGISLKPPAGMQDMKYDMCGGAAVLAAMNTIGLEKPDCNVVAIVPATDNMVGSNSVKPGDVIVHYNKVSAEVINTDAEGRLILADAIAYGIEKYKPTCVIDLATLTGAVIVGLGHHYSGLLSNNSKLAKKLVDAGRRSGEPIWRLPLGPQYAKQIESKVADIKNTGGRAGGTITAAEYIQKFVEKTPWAHLDIAGTAWGFTQKSYIPEGGPSGTGVRTLVELIRRWRKTDLKKK